MYSCIHYHLRAAMARTHTDSASASVLFCLISATWIILADGFMTGAPNGSCKDPSTFHTRKLNATHEGIILPRSVSSNPYLLDVDAIKFGPGSRITVTISGGNSRIPMKGFFIQAVQANVGLRDLRRQAFGSFLNTTSKERPAICQSVKGIDRGGITHTTNETKMSASAVWVAPPSVDPGNIQFLATGVFDYDTYWTNIRSPVVMSEGYVKQGAATHPVSTATATWYRWLQFIRQQQSLANLMYQHATATQNQQQQQSEKQLTEPQQPQQQFQQEHQHQIKQQQQSTLSKQNQLVSESANDAQNQSIKLNINEIPNNSTLNGNDTIDTRQLKHTTTKNANVNIPITQKPIPVITTIRAGITTPQPRTTTRTSTPPNTTKAVNK